MSDWLDETFYLPAQTEIDRAVNYPYDAPDTAFIFDNGRLRAFDDAAILDDRTAVLSVGSNRAPVQLRRKFGDAAIIPVTPAVLHDCDIVHAAQLGYYGAVPCTAFPAAGCEVRLNVAWLDCAQLEIMHRTEAVGIAYDFIRFNGGAVTHLPLPVAGGEIISGYQPVFGYAARGGALDVGAGQPAGLSRILAKNRIFRTMSQAEAARFVRQLTGHDDHRSLEHFVADMQANRAERHLILERLSVHMLFAEEAPWQIIEMQLDDLEAYL